MVSQPATLAGRTDAAAASMAAAASLSCCTKAGLAIIRQMNVTQLYKDLLQQRGWSCLVKSVLARLRCCPLAASQQLCSTSPAALQCRALSKTSSTMPQDCSALSPKYPAVPVAARRCGPRHRPVPLPGRQPAAASATRALLQSPGAPARQRRPPGWPAHSAAQRSRHSRHSISEIARAAACVVACKQSSTTTRPPHSHNHN